MAKERTGSAEAWNPEILRELDKQFGGQPDENEVLMSDIEALEDLPSVDGNAARGACRHGVADDNDCITCRTDGCAGGNDCACASVAGFRRRLAYL